MAPILLKQMVYFYPGYGSVTWWRHQRIKKHVADPHVNKQCCVGHVTVPLTTLRVGTVSLILQPKSRLTNFPAYTY